MPLDSSIELYKELLKHTDELLVFLENDKLFHNHFKFNEINEKCYVEMYENVKPNSKIPTLPELKQIIPNLDTLENEAYKFFIKPRNKSIKGLDVQKGNKIDEVIIKFLNSQKINCMRADVKNKKLPDLQILDKTRNISAYIEVKYHGAPFMLSRKLIGRENYEGSITLDTKKLRNQVVECKSEIPDRPVYILHWLDFHHLKGIFFNTLDQIEDYLELGTEFTRNTREGDYKLVNRVNLQKGYIEKFYPPLHEMGDLSELVQKLKSL